MQMFVFEDVLTDYTSGMVVIAAATQVRALEIAREQYGGNVDIEPGWQRPTGVYGATGIEREGILHEVFGGS